MIVQSLAGIAVEVEAYPASNGYLSGYAKLSTGQRLQDHSGELLTTEVTRMRRLIFNDYLVNGKS